MKKKILTIALFCAAFVANAANLLWKVDIVGGIANSYEGIVLDKNMSFVEYFESHTIPRKAETDGIDLIAKTSSGAVLSWLYVGNSQADTFENKYGPWLEKDGGGGYEYCAIAMQLVLDELRAEDSIQIFAGYFDWDNVDGTLEIDEAKFTPFAVSTIAYEDVPWGSTYHPGDLGPSSYSTVYQWASVPEPSTISLLALGFLMFLRKTRKTR